MMRWTNCQLRSYQWMFSGCSKLVNIPEILPATALVEGCYGEMFSGCSKLQHVTCLATYIPIYYCTGGWLSGVASTGTFNQAVGAAWSTGTSGIPSGWKINKTEKPENPEPESKYLTMTVPEGSPTTQISISTTANCTIGYAAKRLSVVESS